MEYGYILHADCHGGRCQWKFRIPGMTLESKVMIVKMNAVFLYKRRYLRWPPSTDIFLVLKGICKWSQTITLLALYFLIVIAKIVHMIQVLHYVNDNEDERYHSYIYQNSFLTNQICFNTSFRSSVYYIYLQMKLCLQNYSILYYTFINKK